MRCKATIAVALAIAASCVFGACKGKAAEKMPFALDEAAAMAAFGEPVEDAVEEVLPAAADSAAL